MGGGHSKAGVGSKTVGIVVTDNDGNKTRIVIQNGMLTYADDVANNPLLVALGYDPLNAYQQAYDSEGSIEGLINRINNIGLANATPLTQKALNTIEKQQKQRKQEQNANYTPRHTNRGINRHRNSWSAM